MLYSKPSQAAIEGCHYVSLSQCLFYQLATGTTGRTKDYNFHFSIVLSMFYTSTNCFVFRVTAASNFPAPSAGRSSCMFTGTGTVFKLFCTVLCASNKLNRMYHT